MKLALAPIDFEDACAFVAQHHRHRDPPRGHKFSLAALDGDQLVGVVIVGRPVARMRQDGFTLEITRLCAIEGLPRVVDRRGVEHAAPVCSFLEGAAARATIALGYRRLGTYILRSETGVSLRAAGYRLVGETKGRDWSCASRPRHRQSDNEDKFLFEAAL